MRSANVVIFHFLDFGSLFVHIKYTFNMAVWFCVVEVTELHVFFGVHVAEGFFAIIMILGSLMIITPIARIKS